MGLFRCELEQSGGVPMNGFTQVYSGASNTTHLIPTTAGDLIFIVAFGGASSKLAYNRFTRSAITGIDLNSVQDLGYFYDSGTAYAAGTFTSAVASSTAIRIQYTNACYVKAFKATRV